MRKCLFFYVSAACAQTYNPIRTVRMLSFLTYIPNHPAPAYRQAGWCSSPKIGEVPDRAEGYKTHIQTKHISSYPLRYARPPTLGGQLHSGCLHYITLPRRTDKPDGAPHLK